MLTKEQKNELIRTYGKNEHDSGSTEVQIALLTARIVYLTEQFQAATKGLSLSPWAVAPRRSTAQFS